MKHYSQLTSEQRHQIYALLKLSTIASVIDVHKPIVGREIPQYRLAWLPP